ncbi:MAG TPA: porin [Hyphomicrobium sp.]|nr:porin [Hyphomicrobium sp.]
MGKLWRYGAAALLIGGWAMPAAAADLGGDCCADLEERVAELEATSARKGNRKVSLTVSGWVNENVMWWDDGHESNTYVGTNPVEQTRFRFVGEAKVTPDVTAGYLLEIGVWGANSSKFDQNSADGSTGANSLLVRKSNWYLKSKTFGKVSVGLESTATYHLLDDADTTMTRNFYDAEGAPDYMQNFFLRNKAGNKVGSGAGLRWSDALRGFNNSTPGDSGRRNIVRYETPTFGGFTVAATWGEDDIWDMMVSYVGQAGDFRYTARAGYGNSTDGASTPCQGTAAAPYNGMNCEWWGVAGLVQHVPTGLYVYAGYGDQNNDTRANPVPAAAKGLVKDNDLTWLVQGGIENKWNSFGKTNFFGEYRRDEAGSNVSATGTINTQGANVNFWAVGAAQNFEAAELTMYLVYQHVDGDVVVGGLPNTTATDLSAFQQVIGGAKINF